MHVHMHDSQRMAVCGPPYRPYEVRASIIRSYGVRSIRRFVRIRSRRTLRRDHGGLGTTLASGPRWPRAHAGLGTTLASGPRWPRAHACDFLAHGSSICYSCMPMDHRNITQRPVPSSFDRYVYSLNITFGAMTWRCESLALPSPQACHSRVNNPLFAPLDT